ncbi:MAG: hypothetical protein JO257_15365 [Deltaproteobacteria bacterium]|nr:hypothetical protein [Deltaproteobacteria bacterium]
MVFGLFSKERALQKTIEKATNKLAQQQDRWSALERLREDGSEEALYGLTKRFGITSLKGVEDEQEKNWVVDVLVEKGNAYPAAVTGQTTEQRDAGRKQNQERVLAALVRFIKSSTELSLSYPLRVVEKVADHDKVIELVDSILESEPPGYARFPERRIDLIKWFCEWKGASDDEILPRITPYLADFDENVRFTAIDGLSSRAPDRLTGPLIDALVRPEEESGRIRRTIVEVLERKKVPLAARAQEVAGVLKGPLAEDFKVDAGLVKKK